MKIFVKTIDNSTFPIEVSESNLTSALKRGISGLTSIAEDRQRLIFRGKVLEDDKTLSEYQIEEENVIHLVVRPEKKANPIIAEEPTVSTAALPAPPSNPSLEHIRQGFMTVRTVLSSIDDQADIEIPEIPDGSHKLSQYFVGQWLDVKDTVSQWLEATVMNVDHENNSVFIHYNGWPNRWDEWISCTSPRLSPFRSRTVDAGNANVACPVPVNSVANAPNTGVDDFRLLIPELSRILGLVQPLMEKASILCAEEPSTGASASNGTESSNDMSLSSARAIHFDSSIRKTFGELSSVVDRLGRIMVDMAPHFHHVALSGNDGNQSLSPSSASASSISSNVRDCFFDPIARGRGSLLGANNNSNNSSTDPTTQLNIHIAVISPPQRNTVDTTLSQAVATLQQQSASLARQQQRLESLRRQQLELQRQQLLMQHSLEPTHSFNMSDVEIDTSDSLAIDEDADTSSSTHLGSAFPSQMESTLLTALLGNRSLVRNHRNLAEANALPPDLSLQAPISWDRSDFNGSVQGDSSLSESNEASAFEQPLDATSPDGTNNNFLESHSLEGAVREEEARSQPQPSSIPARRLSIFQRLQSSLMGSNSSRSKSSSNS